MGKYKMYAVVYHIERDSFGVKCELAYCESGTKEEIESKLFLWLESRTDVCETENCNCKGSGMIVKELTSDIIASGVTEKMIEIE